MSEVKIPLFERKATGLVREIGPLGLLMITMSYAIGGGINKLAVENGALYPGSHVGLGYLISGIPVLLVGICYGLIAITMPRSGGAYVFISRILGPTVGFLASWISWVGGILLNGIIAYYDVDFWGMMLWSAGAAFKSSALMNAGLWCMVPTHALIVGFLILVVAFLISCARIGIVVRIIQALWLIPAIGSILILIFYGANWGIFPATQKAQWDAAMGAGAYDEVMSIANANGFSSTKWTTFDMGATMSVATYAGIWAYGSPATPSTSVAGEVKTPTKTLIIGVIGGIAMIVLYYTLVSTLMYGAWDPFIRAYAFNYKQGLTGQYMIQPKISPLLPLFVGVSTGNLALAAFFAAACAIWLFNDIPAFMLYLTRFVFAWSFDRSFPAVFAKVSPRLRSPINANLLVFILSCLACLSCFGYRVYAVFPYLDQTTCLMWIFVDMFVALSAMALPIMLPKIYKESPLSAYELFGVPLTMIFGVLGFAGISLFVWLIIGVIAPGGAPTSDIWLWIGSMAVGLIISLAFQHRASRKGIPVSEIFKMMPPA